MRAFEIQLNGSKLCTAGVRDDESLSVIVSNAPNGRFLYVGGSVGSAGDHAQWIDFRQIAVGDVVTVKVVDAVEVDEPKSVEKSVYALPNNWPPPDVTNRREDGVPVRVACPKCKVQFSSEELDGSCENMCKSCMSFMPSTSAFTMHTRRTDSWRENRLYHKQSAVG